MVHDASQNRTGAGQFAWPLLVIAVAAVIMYPGVREATAGSPLDEWLVDVVLGVLLLLLYFAPKLVARIEGEQRGPDRFGRSSWTSLLMAATWVVVGGALLALGYSSAGVVGFTVFGTLGVLGMLYKLRRARRSRSRDV